jgi:alkylated DNA repair dioxygenase AlkB
MTQLDIFSAPESHGEILVQNGIYNLIPSFFNSAKADLLLNRLTDSILWNQESMSMYGKQVLFPRLTAWYGENDRPYSFSGLTLNPKPWTSDLLSIKSEIEQVCDCIFNSVLLNRYRNGQDSISWHTDAEKELGRNPIIASVNFGAERTFQLRHIHTKEKISMKLTHGSLLVMKGELQHYWQHQVPKEKNVLKERINLTFRVIK